MDIQVIDVGNGGDLVLNNGDLAIANDMDNEAYLAHFGGNLEAETTNNEQPGVERFDWWGNQFMTVKSQQMNSKFEKAFNETTLNSAGRKIVEKAANDDFEYAASFMTVLTDVSIVGDGRIELNDKLTNIHTGRSTFYDNVVTLATTVHTGPIVDPQWIIGAGFNSVVYVVKLQGVDKIICAGQFTTYNGDHFGKICRLNIDGTIDRNFNLNGSGFNSTVQEIITQPDGKLIVGGAFTTYNGLSVPRGICRLKPNGDIDDTFNFSREGVDGYVYALAIQKDGRILVGGVFYSYNGDPCPACLIRLKPNGTIDPSFNGGGAGFEDVVLCISAQSNGDIFVGGNLSTYNGSPCPINFCKITQSGIVDVTFTSHPAGLNGAPNSINVLSDGTMLISGSFSSYDTVACKEGLIRLLANGDIDPSFNTIGSGVESGKSVYSTTLQMNGKILLSGNFGTYNGDPCPFGLIRVNYNGTIDNTFNTGELGANNYVYPTLSLPSNKIIVGGNFTKYNTTVAGRIIRLNYDGTTEEYKELSAGIGSMEIGINFIIS